MTSVVLARPLSDGFACTAETRAAFAGIEVVVADRARAGQLALADVLVTGFPTQTADPLELARRMPRLRWIHTMTAGLGTLVSPELLEREIVVTNASGAYATAIAEYVFAALVLLARGLPDLLAAGRERRWSEHELGRELAGTRVGIVGFGAIGRRIGELCKAAGMEVVATRRRPVPEDSATGVDVRPPGEIDELFATCDAIVLAAASNRGTHGIVGARELALMPAHAVLVNVARGELVDEPALVAALRAGEIAGAMIDVAIDEPLPVESALWSAPNLWITPHMAGGTRASRARSLGLLAQNLRRYATGGELVNVVDLSLELLGSAGDA
jgi:phosphoglycerate dehydrogenase-like enzyme